MIDIDEIVAAQIGSRITNVPAEIVAAIDKKSITRFLSRKHIKFMAACDLGPSWTKLANGPTLFLYDEDSGEFQLP